MTRLVHKIIKPVLPVSRWSIQVLRRDVYEKWLADGEPGSELKVKRGRGALRSSRAPSPITSRD
jgi:hypothetical protein